MKSDVIRVDFVVPIDVWEQYEKTIRDQWPDAEVVFYTRRSKMSDGKAFTIPAYEGYAMVTRKSDQPES